MMSAPETAKIEVEVAVDRYELADIDPDSCSPFAQTLRCLEAGRIVVARDIKAEEGRGQIEGGEVVGRETGDHRH